MRLQNTRSGIILIDVLLALTLATLFIAVITESSLGARDLFGHAHEQMALMDQYLSHSGIDLKTGQYGNERIQGTFSVSSQGIATTSPYHQSVSFVSVGIAPALSLGDAVGTSLCSPDFMDKNVVGSYSFLDDQNAAAIGWRLNDAVASITPILLPISPAIPLTDIEMRDGIAYISADSAVSSDPDIFIVDIRDASHPAILSTLNTGPGISSIAVAGKRIFAAAISTAAQLHVIRMDALNSLALEKKYKLPLPYATATPPLASAISYSKGKVFLGTEKWDGDELSVIDVSNPALPVKISGIEIGAKVNDVVVRNDIAYVVSADQQLGAVDISDADHPIVEASFSPSGWQRQEGKAIASFEDSLAFGRTSGGFNIPQDHEMFVWPKSYLMSSAVPDSTDIPGGVYGVVADKQHIYAATRTAHQQFSIFDSTASSSASDVYQLPYAPQAMTCDGDKLYILANKAPYIYEISFK